MKLKRLFAALLSAILIFNSFDSSIIAHANDTENSSTESVAVEEQQESDEEIINKKTEDIKELIDEEEFSYEKIISGMMGSGAYSDILYRLGGEYRNTLYSKLTQEELYKMELHTKYAFINEMILLKNKESIEEKDAFRLSSYFNPYIEILDFKTEELDESVIKTLEASVLKRINSFLDYETAKEITTLTDYENYLQQSTDINLADILNKMNAYGEMEWAPILTDIQEFKNSVYEILGFEDLSDAANKELEKLAAMPATMASYSVTKHTYWTASNPSTGNILDGYLFEVNGIQAFCSEYPKSVPVTGTAISSVVEQSNEMLRKALYYGYGGPGSVISSFTTDVNRQIAMTAVACSDAYYGESATNVVAYWDTFYNALSDYDSPPAYFKVYTAITADTDMQDLSFYQYDPVITNTINHWSWGFKNGEGHNGNKQAFKLAEKTFDVTAGNSFKLDTDKKVTIPNGFYLNSTFGTSAISGTWQNYSMGTSVTQNDTSMSFEYDYHPYTYNITYELNGGTNHSSNPDTYNVLYGVTLEAPTKEGSVFAGWTDADGNPVEGINPDANATFSSADDMYKKLETRTTGDITLYAQWLNEFDITYELDDGENHPDNPNKYIYGEGVSEFFEPTKDGNKFLGWYSDPEFENLVTEISTTHSGDITLYAKWDPLILVVYEGNEATSGTLQSEVVAASNCKEDGYVIKENENFTDYAKDNAIFSGWDGNRYVMSYETKYKTGADTNTVTFDDLMEIRDINNSIQTYSLRTARTISLLSAQAEEETGVENVPSAYLYAIWDEAPEIVPNEDKNVVFYEGQTVTGKDLLDNMYVVDYEDENKYGEGCLNDSIRITSIKYAEGKLINNAPTEAYETTWETGMPDDEVLDTWFLQMNKNPGEVSHIVTYEVQDSYGNVTEFELEIKVLYNEYPEIHGEDRYFTFDEIRTLTANEGDLEKELLSKVKATDVEDDERYGKGYLNDKITLVGFDVQEFKDFCSEENGNKSGYIVVNYKVHDSMGPVGECNCQNSAHAIGKETIRQFVVYITDGDEIAERPNVKYVRFIDGENYYKNYAKEGLSDSEKATHNTNGGLNVDSKWYLNTEYSTVITNSLASDSGQAFSFNHQTVKDIKSFTQDASNFGNLELFIEKFLSIEE